MKELGKFIGFVVMLVGVLFGIISAAPFVMLMLDIGAWFVIGDVTGLYKHDHDVVTRVLVSVAWGIVGAVITLLTLCLANLLADNEL